MEISFEHLREKLVDYPDCRRFLQVWEECRQGRPIPFRGDILPEKFGASLRMISIMEAISEEEVIVRIAQTFLEDLAGMNFKGCNFIELSPPEFRDIRKQRLARILAKPCGMLSHTKLNLPGGQGSEYISLTLPAADSQTGAHRFLLTCFGWQDHISRHALRDVSNLPLPETVEFVDLGAGGPG